MKSIRMLAVTAVLGALTACGGGNDAANNIDANAALEENLDAGLNTTDVNAATDLNASTDVNGTDLNGTNSVEVTNTPTNTTNTL